MHGHVPLQRSRRSVALHGSLPFSKRQVAILSPIIEVFMRPMIKAGCHVRLCRTIGAKFIGDDPFRNKAIALHQRQQQTLGGLFVSPLLQDFFENGAMLIDRTLKPELGSSTFHHDFVQIPNIAGACLSSSQIASNLRSKLVAIQRRTVS